MLENGIKPVCIGCGKSPNEIREYIRFADEENMTPEEYVRLYEGTYNSCNGHFYCTKCYIETGTPKGKAK
ncbi:MAG: hypothetical protein N2749_01085 [Clostridia bacterium]|nr:hypothetical protein [Clostridia bacterium]